MAGRRRWSACGEPASAEGKSWKGELRRRRRRRLKITAGGGGGHMRAWWEMTNALRQPTGQTPRTQGMGWPGAGRQRNERPGDPSGSTCGAAITEQAAPPKTAVRRTGGSWRGVRAPASAGQAGRGHTRQALMESTRQTHVGLPPAAPNPAEGPLWRPLLLCFCEGREQDPWGSLLNAARRKDGEEGAPREGSAERAPRLELTRRAGSTSEIRSRLQQAIS